MNNCNSIANALSVWIFTTARTLTRAAGRSMLPGLALALLLAAGAARAEVLTATTAQELQNYLTTAAGNGEDNTIYIAAGYYAGNFNYNNTDPNSYSLTLQAASDAANNEITLDGGGGGRALSITSVGPGKITVIGLTFSRNCGSTTVGALRIVGPSNADIEVEDCRFLSPAGTMGMGLEITSGKNAIVKNCTVIGTTDVGTSGTGIAISGVTGNVRVENSVINSNVDNGLRITGADTIVLSKNMLSHNSGHGSLGGGAHCQGRAITLKDNLFSHNVEKSFGGFGGGGGGGAFCNGTELEITGNHFTGNRVLRYAGGTGGGGGLLCFGGENVISGNVFSGNSSGNSGGGVFCGGTTTFTDNVVEGNHGDIEGGGVYCSGILTFTGNTFRTNSASGSGGGAYCSGPLVLENNSFTGNSASLGAAAATGGGGVYSVASSATIRLRANTFKQNAAIAGGGIHAAGPTIILLGNLVVKNSQSSASSQGGGIWVNPTAAFYMINNTVTGNSATGSGGGVAFGFNGVNSANVHNNIIWGNSANISGGDVRLSGSGNNKVFSHNNVSDMEGVWDTSTDNLDDAPQFFDPVSGDYHIQDSSPCKNVGVNAALEVPDLFNLDTDLDGEQRTFPSSGFPLFGRVDLGCYEFSTAAKHPADENGDNVITEDEYNNYAAAWKSGDAWTTGPDPISAEYVTRAGYLKANGGNYINDGSARPVNWKVAP
ncbi:MAG: right-handed parallel beta-helix repeat-containing protein [Verrucomicrobiae bacterium]|nr:right-handed parallel beta-helix repeat-containing protein [Verrucomicrobiae bacterium]